MEVYHAKTGPWYLLPRPFSCAKICCRLDRRQVVRHWVLVPAFAGSNPAGPANQERARRAIFVGRQDESQDSPNARSLATTAHCLYPAGPANQERARRAFLLAIKKAPVLAPWGDVTLWRQVAWYSNVSLELCVKSGIMLVASVSARRNRHRLLGLIFHAVELLHQSVNVACVFVCCSGVQDFGGDVIGCGFFHCLVPFRLFGGPFYKCSA